MKIVYSDHCPADTAYLINPNTIVMHTRRPSRWLRLACFLTGRRAPTGWDFL